MHYLGHLDTCTPVFVYNMLPVYLGSLSNVTEESHDAVMVEVARRAVLDYDEE
jgi:hypothetical protein